MNDPNVFCPGCGRKAVSVVLYTDDPGEGFGSANCPVCGGIDYWIHGGFVVEARLVSSAEMIDNGDEDLSTKEYSRELAEYMLEEGLV